MSNSAIVVLRRAPLHEVRRFLCSVTTWEFLSDLGQTFGWHPRGSTYVTTARQRTPPSIAIRHNYQPGGMQDGKQIEAADATEWARALGIARHSSYFSGMIRAHATLVRSAEEPLRDMVDEFIDFARVGAFVFSLCSEPDGLDARAN
ncbi:hypothetical protein ACFPN2_25210 [Steroidobacter flavus]|uniref:Uncharacterized protein n=1 Tax=Steroidobacter flavus TaxID=1842136 RepID=A0ABV8SZB0_9GAMM